MAPNGHTVAVVAYLESVRKNAIEIYELGSAGAKSLAGTEGANYPFWSPDGRSLAFFADGRLKKMELSARCSLSAMHPRAAAVPGTKTT